ncbi:MAG: histidinol-phosphate transaminase [Dysgonamonadaceae bacterium]|jgi:histidinol-phosphate aminotransferase|nr:histidinol-phosphate transaminase [Dysgonamonadaceae bacterium]
MDIKSLVRENIYSLKPYSCARDEFQGEASVYLDANENPYNNPYNRYPDPLQNALKQQIAKIKNISPLKIMLGNGSDEPIDLIFRIFCEPKTDNVVAMEPTYGMYKVCADINDVEYRKVLLDEHFRLDADKMLAAADKRTKVMFICSPNNPTSNLMPESEILKILDQFGGITVIDEAYIDFANTASWLESLDKYPNLIVLHTFSKAWGMASVRCGMAFASEKIIALFNKVKYPYNVNLLTQQFVSEAIADEGAAKAAWVAEIIAERQPLAEKLKSIEKVEKVYPSDANFLLVKVENADKIYKKLTEDGIIVRNRSSVALCGDCLRITVGTKQENKALTDALQTITTISV